MRSKPPLLSLSDKGAERGTRKVLGSYTTVYDTRIEEQYRTREERAMPSPYYLRKSRTTSGNSSVVSTLLPLVPRISGRYSARYNIQER